MDGVLRITRIRLTFRGTIPPGASPAVERILPVFAKRCPAYMSVRGCIDVRWTAELVEAPR